VTSSLVSVIMPTHDSAQWIADSIESVLRQTWTDLELIIVDDGSTDDSRAICAPSWLTPGFDGYGSKSAVPRQRGIAACRRHVEAGFSSSTQMICSPRKRSLAR